MPWARREKSAADHRPSPVTDTLNMRFIHSKAFKNANRSGEVQEIFQDKEKVFALSKAF